jgi:hypothetical protein
VIGDGGDDVTVSYPDLGMLMHAAACDPQLQKLTAAGSTLVRAVCARADGGTTDAPPDGM